MKKSLILTVLLICVATVPKELIKFTVSSYILPDKKLEMQLDVVAPRLPDIYPVIFFVTGLSGVAPSYFQSNLIDSIA
jgi:hypothetical protein